MLIEFESKNMSSLGRTWAREQKRIEIARQRLLLDHYKELHNQRLQESGRGAEAEIAERVQDEVEIVGMKMSSKEDRRRRVAKELATGKVTGASCTGL